MCEGNSIHFRHTNGCFCDGVTKFLRQKMCRPEGDSKPPTFEFMSNALTIWAIRAKHLLSVFLNTGSGDIDMFKYSYHL